MQKPALTPPRRRWWHRRAVLETDAVTGLSRILSWHLTRFGGEWAATALYCEYAKRADVLDLKDWRIMPRSHPLTLATYARQHAEWKAW